MKYQAEIGLAALGGDAMSILKAVLKSMVPFRCIISAAQAAYTLWEAREIMNAPTQTERNVLIVKLCVDVAKDFV